MTIAYFIFSQVLAALFLYCLLFLDSERSLLSTCFFVLNIFLAEVSFVLVWWSTRFSGKSYEFNTQGITEKTIFLESRKNDWEHTALFECDEELLKELVGVLPKQLVDEIRIDAWQLGWLI